MKGGRLSLLISRVLFTFTCLQVLNSCVDTLLDLFLISAAKVFWFPVAARIHMDHFIHGVSLLQWPHFRTLRVIPDLLIYHGWTDFERSDHLASYRTQFPRFAMCRDLPISSGFCWSFFHMQIGKPDLDQQYHLTRASTVSILWEFMNSWQKSLYSTLTINIVKQNWVPVLLSHGIP